MQRSLCFLYNIVLFGSIARVVYMRVRKDLAHYIMHRITVYFYNANVP